MSNVNPCANIEVPSGISEEYHDFYRLLAFAEFLMNRPGGKSPDLTGAKDKIVEAQIALQNLYDAGKVRDVKYEFWSKRLKTNVGKINYMIKLEELLEEMDRLLPPE